MAIDEHRGGHSSHSLDFSKLLVELLLRRWRGGCTKDVMVTEGGGERRQQKEEL